MQTLEHGNYYNTADGDLPDGVDEEAQIKKYGGFYIARYEAGVPENGTLDSTPYRDVEGIPVSKKNQIPWNYISVTTAKKNAESMISNVYVQSILLTDKMKDTALLWTGLTGDINNWYDVDTLAREFGLTNQTG